MVFNITTGCFDYWSKAQGVWLSICGTPPPAVFDISSTQCSAIKAVGNYKEGEMLNQDVNKLIVPITVTQPGTYTMTATTANGFFSQRRILRRS